jgi:GNAT superfamily N-acetyltransferase
MEELLQQIRTRYPFVKIWAFESADRVELQQIEVPPEHRGSGIGTEIMQELKNYARSVGKPIVLRPEPERGKKAALERFYKRLGFVNNAGRHKDYTLSAPFSKTMYWKFREWLMAEGVESEIDSRIKVMLSKRKRNWRKLMGVDPIPRLVRLYELLGGYDRNERDYYAVMGIRNFVMSVIVGCLVQSLYGEEISGIFYQYDLLQLCRQLPLVDTLEEAVGVGREIYGPNHGIRIAMSKLWTTDLMRSI